MSGRFEWSLSGYGNYVDCFQIFFGACFKKPGRIAIIILLRLGTLALALMQNTIFPESLFLSDYLIINLLAFYIALHLHVWSI